MKIFRFFTNKPISHCISPSHMRLNELNSKFSKTTGLGMDADFRVWGQYIFGKAKKGLDETDVLAFLPNKLQFLVNWECST